MSGAAIGLWRQVWGRTSAVIWSDGDVEVAEEHPDWREGPFSGASLTREQFEEIARAQELLFP